MRIVYVSYLHPAVAPGGAQQVAYELFQASLKNGDDAYFIAALERIISCLWQARRTDRSGSGCRTRVFLFPAEL